VYKRFLHLSRTATILMALLPVVAQATATVGEIAPPFTLESMDGKQLSLTDYRGKKAVYLVFWATWCSNCEAEIPKLKATHLDHANHIELIAINTSINDSMRRVEHYTHKHELPYRVAFDQGSTVTQLYGVVGTPTQVIIDINGTVRYRGADSPTDLAQHLPALLSTN